MSEVPQIEFADEACMLATWRSIVVPVFGHRPASVEGARALGKGLERHGRKVGKGRLLEITLLDENAPTPHAEVREALDAMVPTVAPFYGAVSAIFEGNGFRAAMIRGILTGFQLISRGKYPQRICATPDECAAWLFPLAREQGLPLRSPDEIIALIAFVKAEGVKRDVLTQPMPIANRGGAGPLSSVK